MQAREGVRFFGTRESAELRKQPETGRRINRNFSNTFSDFLRLTIEKLFAQCALLVQLVCDEKMERCAMEMRITSS